MTIDIIHGDMLPVLGSMCAEEKTVHAVVTDPPYGLAFMGKAWDAADNVAFRPGTWRLCFELLPPGGYLLAFSGTRTYHRMAMAIEEAGFEIRDMVQWIYGSGFPKSLDVSKAIDRANGDSREKVRKPNPPSYQRNAGNHRPWMDNPDHMVDSDAAASAASAAWEGWGTALKPACEPICLARKPFSGTVAANVLAHGTGALNVDGCRVEWRDTEDAAAAAAASAFAESRARGTLKQSVALGKESRDGTNRYDPAAIKGRWPANVVHDGSDEVLSAFSGTTSSMPGNVTPSLTTKNVLGTFKERSLTGHIDSGSVARFFYSAKAGPDDRMDGNTHPTVKPVDLMRWLVRLITPPRGVVLDPFAGSGSTAVACARMGVDFVGVDFVGVERELEYVEIARKRVARALVEHLPIDA